MQLTQIQRVSGNIFEINSEKLKSGNGNFKIIRAEFFRVGNVFVARGIQKRFRRRPLRAGHGIPSRTGGYF